LTCTRHAAHLELMQTLRDEPAPTLISLLDNLPQRHGQPHAAPLAADAQRDRTQATQRHGAIAELLAHGFEPLRDGCGRHVADVERISARIALRQVRPRELAGLRATLQALPCVAPLLAGRCGFCWTRSRLIWIRPPELEELLRRASPPSLRNCCARAA